MLYSNMIVDNTYQIIDEIGSGGMGIVYLAYHLRLEKYVVMKKIKNTHADISMLRNEVDILKSLHHPYLPQVYDFLEYDYDLYTIIDYIDGYDLNYYINNNCVFSESQLIKWLIQLCEVLEYLHSQTPQILHTDIKPGNIMITGNGDICLIDFGISLYSTDVVKGLSENYSSPEQFQNVQNIIYGRDDLCVALDERTDIYSLGATFYHLITGVKPSVCNVNQPPISQYELDYSETFIAIIEKAMCFEREKRFSNAGQMIKAIHNMRKSDIRYKRYIAIQILSSLIAGIMIFSGIALIVSGYHNDVVESFQSEYSQFMNYYKIGDTDTAAESGRAIVSNSDYSNVIDNSTKAQILHAIGECYYLNDDYYNSAYYYDLAIDFLDNTDNEEIYYRDYAFSLICENRIDEAYAVLNEITQKFPNSLIISLVEAELCYRSGDYNNAITSVDKCFGGSSDDNENLYAAYVIKGDSYNALENYREAVNAYTSALENKETVTVLRKLGNTCLECADKYPNEMLYNQAIDCFSKINDEYIYSIDDVINLAQSYMLRGRTDDYDLCKNMLKNYISINGEDCRIYIMLAIISSVTEDGNTADYCLIAHRLYSNLSDDEIISIDNEFLLEIKTLYKKYCGQSW